MLHTRHFNMVVILLIVTSCIFVGIRSFQSVQTVQKSNTTLAQSQLPLFEKTQQLRSVLALQNLSFHNYYLNNNDDTFYQTFNQHRRDAILLIKQIALDFGENSNTILLNTNLDKIDTLANEMQSVMASPTDWDGARDVLSKLEPITLSITQAIGTLITDIEKDVLSQVQKSLSHIEQSLFWTMLLNGGLLFVLGLLLWLDTKRNKAQKEIVHFAGFPERNPRPVLALSQSGEINYANPASSELVHGLFNSNNLNALLPEDIATKLSKCRTEGDYLTGEYCLKQYYYDYVLHYLPDLKEFRLYLSDITARKLAEKDLNRLAYFDELTNLNNKASLQRDFFNYSKNYNALFLIDFVSMPQVTMRLGHSATHDAIKACAKRLSDVCTPFRTRLYHLAEERFALCLHDNQYIDAEFDDLMNALAKSFSQTVSINGLDFHIHLAVGATKFDNSVSFDDLMRQANIALRSVYPKGGMVVYTEQLETRTQRRIEIESALRSAIEKEQLSLYFQPQLNLKTNRVSGVEALLRWVDDEGSWISPVEFIPVAEESDLIIEIGQWVLRQAISTCANLFKQQLISKPFSMAINIAPVQLLTPGFCETVLALLSEYNVDAELIELEVTESAALYDIDLAISVMNKLKNSGLKLAMDDFGTGYSSFSYITQLPLSKLKIDQSFIRNMLTEPKLCNVTETMIAMADLLSLTVIAEGVESHEHVKRLKDWGCDEVQGYHIAKPMPLDSLNQWLISNTLN